MFCFVICNFFPISPYFSGPYDGPSNPAERFYSEYFYSRVISHIPSPSIRAEKCLEVVFIMQRYSTLSRHQ